MQEVKQKISKVFFYLIAVCYATEGIVDVVVGSAWPVIAKSLKIDISFIGILVMFYYLGSIAISPNTYRVRQKLGTNYTMVLSQVSFVVALALYIVSTNIYIFTLGMFINGIGCGLMEVNANSYVLKAYDVKEESILSGFWGLGSVVGSTVMAIAVKYYPPYKSGFNMLIVILIVNITLLLLAKASWIKQKKTLSNDIVNIHSITDEERKIKIKISDLIKDKKVILVLLCFFLSQSVIVTMNSLVSTIAVKQGNIIENVAVVVPIIYFAAIFLGRTMFGNIAKNIRTINVLKTNALITALLLILLRIRSFNGVIVCVIMILIGFISAPIIPFMNAYIKELFDVKKLSALLGYGDMCGLAGIIILSGLTTIIMKMTSIQNVELIFAALIIMLYLLLVRTEKENIIKMSN